MNKKLISALLCGTMILSSSFAVFASEGSTEAETETETATEIASETETETETEYLGENLAEGMKVALVAKSAGNAFFEIAAEAYVKAIELEGGEVEVIYPEAATADAQIKALDNLISQDFDAICIAANDVNALQAKLEEAMDEDIKVLCFDSATNPDSRQVFVNQAGTVAVGQALMDAVYDIAGGEGQWAVLSATSQAANQNAWIDAMKTIMEEDEKYADMELVEVAYGDDEPQKSTDQTAALLEKYPDLKVICAPTTVGIAAAAKYLQDNNSATKLTGLGLPSEMLEYTGEGEEFSCPYFYLWDMQNLGKLSAYTTISLIAEEITGELEEVFTAPTLGEYTITEADDGGTEIVLGLPLEFNPENIEEMAELY